MKLPRSIVISDEIRLLLFAAFEFAVAGYFLLGACHFAGICDRIRQDDEQGPDDGDGG